MLYSLGYDNRVLVLGYDQMLLMGLEYESSFVGWTMADGLMTDDDNCLIS